MKKASLAAKTKVKEISNDLRQVQKDLRILRAVRWSPEFEQEFLSQSGKPSENSIHFDYSSRPLSFEPSEKLDELDYLEKKIRREIQPDLPDAADILDAIVGDLKNVTLLLQAIGTAEFGTMSETLWGSPKDRLSSSGRTIINAAETFSKSLNKLSDEETERMFPKILNAAGLASLLRQRLQEAHLIESVEVSVTDGLVADAAAGADKIKIRKHAKFSVKDVDVLLYHEVFTHIATSLNGRSQPYAKWLSFDTPRCASTQEGLAVFLEMLSGKTYPRRLKRIVDRIRLTGKIQDGETCGAIYEWLRDMNYSHKESLNLVMRGYRGCDPDAAQPFTKDVSYLKGLVQCFNFIHANLVEGRFDFVHTLFVGKINLDDVPKLLRLTHQGVVKKASWLPPDFLDLDSLAGWFAYVLALGGIHDQELQSRYRRLV